MADLSTAEGRIASARRPTTNRDGILPARRQTDLPNFTVTADMRSAARGDGGARELQKALGLFQDAAGDFGRAREANRADEYAAQRADGALDATTGGVADPAMAKSSAYQEAFYGAKAEGEFRTFEADLKRQLQEKIDGGEDPDAVKEFFQSQVAGFVERTRDGIPVAGAQLATAKSLQALAGELEVGVSKALKDRMDTDFITTVQTNIGLDAAAGRPLEFERYINTIMLTGKSPADAKKAVFDAVVAAAMDPDNPQPELLDELLDSKQADGLTPTVSATDRVQLINTQIAVSNLVERKERAVREEKQTAFYADFVSKLDADEDVDVQGLLKTAYDNGAFTPEEYMQASQATRSFVNFREEGDLDQDVALDVTLRLSEIKSPAQKRTLLNKVFEDGKLGSGTAAKRFYVQQMVQINAEIEARAAAAASGGGGGGGGIGPRGRRPIDVAEDLLDSALKPPSGVSWPDPASVYGLYSSSRTYFYGEVSKGVDPLAAAEAAITKFSYLAKRVEKARGGGAGAIPVIPGAASGGVVAVPASELAKYQ